MLRATPGLSAVKGVLFLCTGNSARSILAEGLANELGAGRVRAFSAGSHPKDQPHPMALDLLAGRGITGDFRSKSWDEFSGPDAPALDIIITVCDNAAGEACPAFPGRYVRAHWGIADPAAVEGQEQRAAFDLAARLLEDRLRRMLQLDLGAPPEELQRQLSAIGRMEGASPGALLHG